MPEAYRFRVVPYSVKEKLKTLKKELKTWKKFVFGNIYAMVAKARGKFESF